MNRKAVFSDDIRDWDILGKVERVFETNDQNFRMMLLPRQATQTGNQNLHQQGRQCSRLYIASFDIHTTEIEVGAEVEVGISRWLQE